MPSVRDQLVTVGWFIGLSLALAIVSIVAGVSSALLPFILALGPTVIAIALAWREGHGALARLRHSLVTRPARRRWYLILGLPVVWSLATVGIAVVLGAPTTGLFDKVFPSVLIVFPVVLIPAIAEEVAWRGFAVPRLMSAMSPLRAALVISIPWTLIHLGLFLPGQMNGSLVVWAGVLSIVSYSVILTWVFVRTGGSVLMTALLHAGLNAVAPVMAGVDLNTEWVIRNILAGLIAVAVVSLGGFRSGARARAQLGAPVAILLAVPMNRILGIVSAMLLGLLILVPVAAAADPWDTDEHLLFNTGGDITLGAGQHADLLVVVDGTATIEGDAKAVFVVNGTANFVGSRTAGIMAIRSHVTLDGGSVVAGDVRTIDSTIESAPGAAIQGTTKDLATDLAGGAVLMASALFLVYVAFAISAIAAGLALAGLAGRQVRDAGALISREPVMTLLAAFAGIVGIALVGVLAIVTVVGAPLGIAILVLVLPALLVAGYLVAGIWIGDRILAQVTPGVVRERPYLAAVLGLAALGVISVVPVIGGIVVLIGFGSVVLLMWRTLRRSPAGHRADVVVTAG